MTASDWATRAGTIRRGRPNAWLIGMAGAAVGTPLFLAGRHAGGVPGMALLVTGAALIALAVFYGTVVHMRRIDEQERNANLWSGYIGLNVYAGLFALDLLARQIGLAGLHPLAIFLATAAAVAPTFLWLRFR